MIELPPKGFYVHYKHTASGVANNYMYEIVGSSKDTESETYNVLYRPLYPSEWRKPAELSSRPLENFLEMVEKDGQTFPRFTRITDPDLIYQLEKVKLEMYHD